MPSIFIKNADYDWITKAVIDKQAEEGRRISIAEFFSNMREAYEEKDGDVVSF